ncbi:aminotransferase [Alcanivorax sp. S71-1-4]|uniref:aspartate aminotransferase family protein n=1 Tax=Alcanivorax sp. S71-1-4 TaxID=1177159 RepID=UPI00135ADB0E|nr:aminotransferase class III-fold pyridoxal phosphate-dependent enzyme [Alcanivorax sp. S71-1-4]KAF0804807.1 aminotransferase [Alcanivorax sp. S71-1-4]
MSHLSPLLKQSSTVCADHGRGSYLFDRAGNSWLDFTSGIGVTATGHCHPDVVDAVREQAGRLVHGQYTTVTHPNMLALTDRLYEKLPAALDAIAFFNAGSEAVEAALRLARHATGRANIIAFQGGFHGRTMAAASLTTSTTKVRTGFHPMMAGVCFSPFPHAYRYGWDDATTTEFCLRELDHLFLTQCAPDDTAAMIIEPVQGEYGYYPANCTFMQGLRERCDRHGILLIADEIQAGYGRTGRFWSHQHFDVTPDILITAKGLASGFPLSAMAASDSLMQQGLPGSQGGTYGANAVSCAAALATLDVIEQEALVQNAQHQGEHLATRLAALRERHTCIDDIRGMGLMLGMEITDRHGAPDGARAAALLQAAEAESLLLLRCGSHGQVVRWLPPLTVNCEEIDLATHAFERALTATGG